jgi:hypothetical protein
VAEKLTVSIEDKFFAEDATEEEKPMSGRERIESFLRYLNE